MQAYLTPNVFPVIVLVVIVFFAVIKFLIHMRVVHHKRQGGKQVFKFQEKKSLSEIVNLLSGPFSVEVGVQYLGKEPNVYIQAPASQKSKIKDLGGEEIEEYSVCGTNDTRIGAYFSASQEGSAKLSDIDIHSFDFSKVNEVGECAMVQFVFDGKQGGDVAMNMRVLVAAPSPFQSKEILSNVKKSIPQLRATEAKNESFTERVFARSFSESEKVIIPA